MVCNKDQHESAWFFEQASGFLAKGNIKMAIQFFSESYRIYPSERTKELLKNLTDEKKEKSNPKAPEMETNDKASEKGASGSNYARAATKSENKGEYTTEQLTAVERVLNCKDYYEVLEVEKECTDNDLKKAYKNLALLMHPDKTKAPGATQAFQAISNAYAVLIDPDKRVKYDVYGPSLGPPLPRGPPAKVPHPPPDNYRGVLLIGIILGLLILLVTYMSYSFVSDSNSDSIYSLGLTQKYSVQRITYKLKVPYYVKEDFKFDGSSREELYVLERSVEEEYVSQIRTNCWRERTERENLLWRTANNGDAKMYQKALDLKTPSCDKIIYYQCDHFDV